MRSCRLNQGFGFQKQPCTRLKYQMHHRMRSVETPLQDVFYGLHNECLKFECFFGLLLLHHFIHPFRCLKIRSHVVRILQSVQPLCISIVSYAILFIPLVYTPALSIVCPSETPEKVLLPHDHFVQKHRSI